jgi:hypothetical protein
VTDIHSQQQQQQLQLQENNNSSRDAKKPQEGLGPDEMWAPGALGHHRELPVDVPDTLLQKAYPNKVKNRSSDYRNGLQHRSRSASDLNLSLNLKNETFKTRIIADGRANRLVSDDRAHHDVTDDAGTNNVRNGLRPSILKIELKIEDEEEKVRIAKKEFGLDEKYCSSSSATAGSPDLKDALEALEEDENVDENTGGQKESCVDVEDDYPFAKEDYPTMLKTCSDGSASPRSSSSRSDSTATLDTSLMLRHGKSNHKDSPTYDVRRIDLGSPCRSVVPDIKVAPLFGRTRDTMSFDNPSYGLTDLQDLQGLLMRSDEVTDLTRLIEEQCSRMPKDQDKGSPVRAANQQLEPPQIEPVCKSGKNAKRRPHDERAKLKAKTRSLDIEELIRASSTDDLLGIELSNFSSSSTSSRQRPKKKRQQQISSGYSTLRSETSGDLEHNADRSFLVVGGKPYREVAVDCPPDFVPITKCHPVYPPPNKTPGNSKHNTLEPRSRNRESVASEGSVCTATTTITSTMTSTHVASPRLSPNDNSFTTVSSGDGSARETAVARTVDRKHHAKKVRSRVKSLIVDSLHSIMHHEHRELPRASSTHCLNALARYRSNEPVLLSFNMNLGELYELPRPCSTVSFTDPDGGKLLYENPRLSLSRGDIDRNVPPRQESARRVRPFSAFVSGEKVPELWRETSFIEGEANREVAFAPTRIATDDSTCPSVLSSTEGKDASSSGGLLGFREEAGPSGKVGSLKCSFSRNCEAERLDRTSDTMMIHSIHCDFNRRAFLASESLSRFLHADG